MKKKFIIIITLFALLLPSVILAEDVGSLSNLKDYYANQAKKARELANQKQQEAAQIQAQIQNVNGQIEQTTASLNETADQIDQTQKKINDLQSQINDQNYQLGVEKDKLGGVISSWYMEGEDSLLEAVLSSGNVSDLVSKHSYYDSIKQQMEGQLEKIGLIKKELSVAKDQADGNLQNLATLKKTQEDEKNYLQGRKSMKNALLNNTTKAISDLQTEQKDAEAKVAELQGKIDKIRAASVGAGGDVVSTTDSSWYYRQNDSRWNDYKIGNYSTIGLYGCLLTSLTMVAKFYGKDYDPVSAAGDSSFVHGGRYDGSLISTGVVSDGKSQLVDWSVIDDELSNNHPVIVGVSLGVDMGNSYGVSHFVVLKSKIGSNKYAMHDPLGESRGYRRDQIKAMRIIRP